MTTYSLKTKIMLYFGVVILFLGISSSLYAYFSIEKYILERAQKEVTKDLTMVRTVYDEELAKIRIALDVADPNADLEILKRSMGLDYLYRIAVVPAENVTSPVAQEALAQKKTMAATRLIPHEEVRRMGPAVERFSIMIKPTPKARPTQRKALDSVLGMEAARVIFAADGTVSSVLYGGKVINENFKLIQLLSGAIFDPKALAPSDFGTVTIFQDDVRVVTTVLDRDGKPAVGTRISEEVYHRVVEQGRRWMARAYVVKDWYLTAYEPLQDIHGNIIGALYIGVLERPYIVIRNKRLFFFLVIMGAVFAVAVMVSYLLSTAISRPLQDILQTVQKISAGELQAKVTANTTISELDILAEDFNQMAGQLKEREQTLAESNQKLQQLNKDYLELIGFVSHELKGILSSVVLNTYMLSDGILGDLNDRQKKTTRSMARNLDYLAQTVKNFLNLSRIEKGELAVNLSRLALKEQVFDLSVEALQQQATEKGMVVTNELEPGLAVDGDLDLLQIAANNLISNAIKYGDSRGQIKLISRRQDGRIEVEVYNDGRPIVLADRAKLFKKFSRLLYTGMERVKGTGVGLFIAKEIIAKHGGTISCEPRAAGNSFIVQLPAAYPKERLNDA